MLHDDQGKIQSSRARFIRHSNGVIPSIRGIINKIVLRSDTSLKCEPLSIDPSLVVHQVRGHNHGRSRRSRSFRPSTPAPILSWRGRCFIGGCILDQPVMNLLLIELFSSEIWAKLRVRVAIWWGGSSPGARTSGSNPFQSLIRRIVTCTVQQSRAPPN